VELRQGCYSGGDNKKMSPLPLRERDRVRGISEEILYPGLWIGG
jgi:hypothetical protein